MVYGDGKLRYIRATYVPDVGPDGAVRGFVAHVTDISDLKEVQELHARAERLESVAALSASLAHEIRNRSPPSAARWNSWLAPAMPTRTSGSSPGSSFGRATG
jgi:hypothetical protein